MQSEIDKHFSRLLSSLHVLKEEQKKRYCCAIDIENNEEAISVAIDARKKFRQLQKWIDDIWHIRNEMVTAYPTEHTVGPKFSQQKADVSDGPQTSTNNIQLVKDGKPPPGNTTESGYEEPKVGAHIRIKLRELSRSGHEFSTEEIDLFQQEHWSKETLNLNYPFVKIYDPSVELSEQLSVDNISYRYWPEVFDFGENRLLICSQWYYGDRIYFDGWYASLDFSQLEGNKSIDGVVDSEAAQENFDGYIGDKPDDKPDIDIPQKLVLFGKAYSVSSWQELLRKLCEVMVLNEPYKFAYRSVKSLTGVAQKILSLDERAITKPCMKLSNGLYITTSGSPDEIKKRCVNILEACGYSSDVFQIC